MRTNASDRYDPEEYYWAVLTSRAAARASNDRSKQEKLEKEADPPRETDPINGSIAYPTNYS
jgi:hypothetical protein